MLYKWYIFNSYGKYLFWRFNYALKIYMLSIYFNVILMFKSAKKFFNYLYICVECLLWYNMYGEKCWIEAVCFYTGMTNALQEL